jgi:hypothetical protein
MVTITREPMAPALHLDHLTDVLHGLNVRHWNYLDLDALAKALAAKEAERLAYLTPYDTFIPQECWTVLVYDDGLDCGYFDDYPGEHAASYHRTQRGAEIEAAHLEDAGIEGKRIRVVFQYQDYCDYNMPIHP